MAKIAEYTLLLQPKNGKFHAKSLFDKKLQLLPTFIVCLVWLQEKVAISG